MKKFLNWLGASSVLVILIGAIFAYPVAYRLSATTVDAKVVKTEAVNTAKSHTYLVFVEGETFQVADSWLFLRFSSSDCYGSINPGATYRMKVAGWRVPLLSWYRNIIEAEHVTD